MAEAKIPVDLFNPGQVFACLGFLEAADVLLGDAEGGFDWTDEANVCFRLRANGAGNPFGVVLDVIANAEVNWLSPSDAIMERDGGKTIVTAGISWSKEPAPADLPAEVIGQINGEERRISFGFWADESGRFSTTFKKSTNGASSHVRFENGLAAVAAILKQARDEAVLRPLDASARTESLFRLDPRGYADPLNAGFSADKLRKGNIDVRFEAYPICELFAVIGLQHARPAKISSHNFRYWVWGFRNADDGFLPTALARAGLGEPVPFLPYRCFVVEHQEVKRGGDRKLISVEEETNL
jgi:CRISPR-associated protein Csx14